MLADFFVNSVPRRIWEPLRDLPFDEIAERASQHSADTIHLLEGFMGVEEYVGDYAQNGLEALRGAQNA